MVTVLLGFLNMLMITTTLANATPSALCARIRLSRVSIPVGCDQRTDACFAEFDLDGKAHHLPFRYESDGSLPEIGFTPKACAGVEVSSTPERPLTLPAGCRVSINLGGPRGAAGGKCLCFGRSCPDEQSP